MIEITLNNLEQSLNSKNNKKGLIRKVGEFFVPAIETYDSNAEAKELLNDPDINSYGVSLQDARRYVDQAYNEHKTLMYIAKTCDTLDRTPSMISGLVEGVGLLFGAAPGIMANLGEEGVTEAIPKTLFFGYALLNPKIKHKMYKLMALAGAEIGSSPIPVGSDAVDVFNLYMRTTKSIIRDTAKDKIMMDYAT